jgi:hypothetical protein
MGVADVEIEIYIALLFVIVAGLACIAGSMRG